jgi:hypothetical protein
MRGMGGVGKTVLAREYAWRNHKRYHGVWWIRAETRETLVDDLVTLGSRFIPGRTESGACFTSLNGTRCPPCQHSRCPWLAPLPL